MEPSDEDVVRIRNAARGGQTKVLSGRQARRLWRRYRRHAGYSLGSIAAAARGELLEKLDAHVSAQLSRSAAHGSMLERLRVVLEDLGPPEQFFAPLVAAAVLARPRPPSALLAPIQSLAMALDLGGDKMRAAGGYALILILATALAAFVFANLFAPAPAGPFAARFLMPIVAAPDGGLPGPLWPSLLILHICGIGIGWTLKRLYDLALVLAMGARPAWRHFSSRKE